MTESLEGAGSLRDISSSADIMVASITSQDSKFGSKIYGSIVLHSSYLFMDKTSVLYEIVLNGGLHPDSAN